MNIIQFEDKPLAHYSYAIISEQKIALVDPSRQVKQYYKLAEKHNAKIVAVFETHPHADFVSSHLQLHKETGADIYVSQLVSADYPHITFDDGDTFNLGQVTFTAINSPGHSPDSITIIAQDHADNYAMFSGDTLFIGDVGRPDLREKAGNMKAKREELAKQMYATITQKFNHLPDHTKVYPAHGAGSLCGKNMSKDASSTLGKERLENWAFKSMTEADFVAHILKDQPFIPSYFGYNVDINKKGAENLESSISKTKFHFKVDTNITYDALIIDIRNQADYKQNHLAHSFNIMAESENDKFETWLGSIVKPEESFYVVLNSTEERETILNRIAKIGYETQLLGLMTLGNVTSEQSELLNLDDFKQHQDQYTILDIRNKSEVDEGKIFKNALAIPLNQLREEKDKIPTDKPIVVHCAGGYRSAAGSSIVSNITEQVSVYDLSDAVTNFK
ncbi:MBL fold metallo-hydrolase [Formosa algae]|uniref:Glyoxylase-like metal-dependent hydrolase (Beta-lactamase superfamily II)/rhodanese-related sulfurtransferase n=1 Tax=Formosa algae TaxID=225843 RepID=A0A9X1CC44_9FLAO|nr:MBL fold metallo-hydrolase [Formosa algae]MBP1840707.1 glyoxylase-like metal-dependent hydrolase (beta-lactamase superfamily II)/rhodanese-related sulfurtransferase [Formosa algae]MDQ0335880.1 glyoxylase-like metal-dependent hydrolase (beta-lactamase superfamily II)/rhodanese-related sulfurtransferase [Formosa algae]OEI81219.1 sulfurtransferase [Formosa algae]